MRRAQRIVRLHGEVVLLAIDWREKLTAYLELDEDGPRDVSTARADELNAACDRLDELVGQLVDELERLAVPA
jgi:hypothetical protein